MTTTAPIQPYPNSLIGPRRPIVGEAGWTIWPHRVWPTLPVEAATGRTLFAVVATGVVAAAVWEIPSVSIGYVLMAAVVFCAAFVAQRRRPTLSETLYIGATLALLAVLAVRAAPWLAVLCVMSAWVTGWLVFTGGRTWTSLALSSVVGWFLPVRACAWLGRGVRRALRFEGGRGKSAVRFAVVVGLTAALLVLFASLFAGADRAFADLLDAMTPSVAVPEMPRRVVTFGLGAAFAAGAAYLIRFRPRFDELAPRPGRAVRRWEWCIPLAALDTLFIAFVGVQLAVLFGGDRYVLETDGLTYSEYARQGFWQLLVVTALTLVVVALAVRKANYETVADRTIVRVLLGILCATSVVVVISAVHRMWVYEQAYGFTELRLFVMSVELWLGAVFLMLGIAGIGLRRESSWLPRAVVASGVVALLALAGLNPDRFIADRNVDRYAETGRIDVDYLATLSADAVPALQRLPEPVRTCTLSRLSDRVGDGDSWNEFNLSRFGVRGTLDGLPTADHVACARSGE